jgi:hypothetical protein
MLQSLVTTWQKRLQLTEWDITAEFVPGTELPEHGLGCVYHDHNRRAAEMYVLNPVDFESVAPTLIRADTLSVEHVVVHELMHVLLWSIYYDHPLFQNEDQRFMDALESTVEHLTRVLVSEVENGCWNPYREALQRATGIGAAERGNGGLISPGTSVRAIPCREVSE